jgi:tRNA U34 2-thiouridine synthase MnmA/TrmU
MKVAMLISGGVDSSVSLRLLRDAGHDITAFYLKIWLEDELAFLGECPWEDDLRYVRAVCEEAGVPLQIANLQKEYWDEVVSYVIAEAKRGRTPNPDILCNSRIKFGMFYDRFGKDFDRVATGHYAQVEEVICHPELVEGSAYDEEDSSTRRLARNDRKKALLKKSPDPIKDQTYFLSQLSQAQVNKVLFPIGGYRKEEVRELAEKYHLPNAARKDSQGICFLGQVAFDKFLEHYLGTKEGNIVDLKTGKVLGTHRGYWFHTIGQRRGLGLSGGPWYVASKDTKENIVFVSNEWRSEEMARGSFMVGGLNWISGVSPLPPLSPSERTAPLRQGSGKLSVKLRHGPKEYPCEVKLLDDGDLSVKLDGFDRGIAPGQFAVFYDGEYCLGGGTIAG